MTYSYRLGLLLLCLGVLLLGVLSVDSTSECNTTCDSPNVRTVLFKQTDLVKECWSEEELVLLYTRRLMQELIPKKVPCRIPLLLEYLKIVLEVTRDVACSMRAHSLVMLAISDALGGYLQAYGVPITNSKYYEGSVTYCTARQVNELQTAFKKTLDTDGGGWTRPVFVRRSPAVAPYVVPACVPSPSCTNLVLNSDFDKGVGGIGQDKLNIPIPFLDDLTNPRAIAVPFRDKSLFSLFSRNSSDILIRYYSNVMKCFGPPPGMSCNDATGNPATEPFLSAYHYWLCRAVLPHLHDDTWYPGFGSVYRILEAMAQKGLSRCENNEEATSDDFSMHLDDTCECKSTSPLFYLAAVIALILLFWIIVCLLCCLLKCCASSAEGETSCSTSTTSSGAFINTLASIYCEKQELEGKGCKSSSSTPLLYEKR